MARPYSNDLRERAALAAASGRSCREVASLFGVSVASVVKWSQRQRATGTAASRQMGGHRKRLLEPHRALVIDRVKAVPDITLKTLVAELAEQGIATSAVSLPAPHHPISHAVRPDRAMGGLQIVRTGRDGAGRAAEQLWL